MGLIGFITLGFSVGGICWLFSGRNNKKKKYLEMKSVKTNKEPFADTATEYVKFEDVNNHVYVAKNHLEEVIPTRGPPALPVNA